MSSALTGGTVSERERKRIDWTAERGNPGVSLQQQRRSSCRGRGLGRSVTLNNLAPLLELKNGLAAAKITDQQSREESRLTLASCEKRKVRSKRGALKTLRSGRGKETREGVLVAPVEGNLRSSAKRPRSFVAKKVCAGRKGTPAY